MKTITGNQSYGEKFVTQLTNVLDLGNQLIQSKWIVSIQRLKWLAG
ncbi:hypothetical protein JCM19235_5596 [Vibrio maritimus]|uniref:Uncharacterized protein n=1 Tax=Vibrio maritimus TaxID=990268 RepID=A0A090SBX3_9VIBR|nr:hypothetical protein JCM19235_5596 [Vibrio maritimus]